MARKVHIAVMAYDGTVPVASVAMVMTAVMAMTQQKHWNVTFHYRTGDSILPRARNGEAANFLSDPDATDLVMIDADTMCSGADIIKLIEHDEDIVGAPYRTRNEPLSWPSVRWLHQDIKLAPNGLLEVEAIGTGLIKISRNAMQRLWDAEPKDYFDPANKTNRAKPLFWFEIEHGHLWGEDLVFCRKWRALGGKVYTDPSIGTQHVGTHSFNGTLIEWLRAQPPTINIEDTIGKSTLVTNHLSAVGLIEQTTKSEAA